MDGAFSPSIFFYFCCCIVAKCNYGSGCPGHHAPGKTKGLEMKSLMPGTLVSVRPEFRDSPEDASGWRVVEDRGDRVLIEAVELLSGSAVASPQTLVGREMIEEVPAPQTVREMTDADCKEYGIDREEYLPTDRLWLAVWPDRSGYYWEDVNMPAGHLARYCTSVFNESECFATAETCHAWLWARLETTS